MKSSAIIIENGTRSPDGGELEDGTPYGTLPDVSLLPGVSKDHDQKEASAPAVPEEVKQSRRGAVQHVSWNFTDTFATMQSRRLMRRYFGVYRKYSGFYRFISYFILFSFFSLLLGTILYRSSTTEPNSGNSITSDLQGIQQATAGEIIAVIAIFGVIAILYIRYALVVKWFVYWFAVAWLIMFLATGEIRGFVALSSSNTSISEEAYQTLREVVYITLVSLEGLTLLAYYSTHSIYPFLVRRKLINFHWWFDLRHGRFDNEIMYLSRAWCWLKTYRMISYVGGVDSEGRPHGYGQWEESSYHGEVLRGWWIHGQPVAPYISSEYGTGYSFRGLRVLIVHDRLESSSSSSRWFPLFHPDGLHYGVASVECSISGQFFKFLPSVSYVLDPEPHRDISWALEKLLTPIDFELRHRDEARLDIQLDKVDGRLIIAGYEPTEHTFESVAKITAVNPQEQASPYDDDIDSHQDMMPLVARKSYMKTLSVREQRTFIADNQNAQRIEVEGWRPRSRNRMEALVFIPGYNCPTDFGAGRLGQMMALGDYPSYVVPILYSWPSGSALTYFSAKNAAESETVRKNFIDFLSSLASAGFNSVHLMAHSMGARVFFNVLKDFDKVFGKVNDTNRGLSCLVLDSVILLNPDFELDLFLSTEYDRIRTFCDHISMYGDVHDNALGSSVLVSSLKTCRRSVSLGQQLYRLYRTTDQSTHIHTAQEASITRTNKLLQCRQTNGMDESERIANIVENCDLVVDQETRYGFLDRRFLARLAKKDDKAESKLRRSYLDMDIMDTTWLEQNIHSMRHSFHEINHALIEDMREIILTGKRAEKRASLVRRQGNVYTFMIAPSVVKN